jgi:hypothetical protein
VLLTWQTPRAAKKMRERRVTLPLAALQKVHLILDV